MSDKKSKNDCGRNGDRRPTIVSFSRNKNEIDIDGDTEDEITLAPYIQTYLAHSGEQFGCCGFCFPVPFERASRKSWWDPKFDSEILEGQYRSSSFAQIRLRFRYSLFYMLSLSLIWCLHLITFGVLDKSQKDAFPLGVIFFLFAIFCIVILLFTRSSLYRRYILPVSIVISLSMCLLSIASVSHSPVLSPASDFAICIEILMIIYTVIPMPLYLCVIMGTIYSVVFEVMSSGYTSPVRIFSHICVHLIALHILIMTNVRMRGTFMKVGQSLLVRRQLEIEKELKEKMIHSVMPPKVADWLMEEGVCFDETTKNHTGGDINSLFRPFNMHCMKDISILFADIVGFTRMSSNKTASELVAVLNVLFERFDRLCAENGCEKIATLGDCYYCVSGCPIPNPRHAHNCVEMGLGMIKIIAQFDTEKSEDVNMRVGVHTGTVLCGIVGRRRFKFDVWSNDVLLANKMESTGQPGRVHISQATRHFLDDDYILEKGEPVRGLETYFIVGGKEPVGGWPELISPTQTVASVGDQSTNILSFDTARQTSPSASLVTATSHPKSVSVTVSPFDKIKDSQLFKNSQNTSQGVSTAMSTPSSPIPIPLPRLLSERLNAVKATSLPNVFAREMQAGSMSRTSLVATPSPKWKYSRLKLNTSSHLRTHDELGNGRVPNTYRSPSDKGSSSPTERDRTKGMHLEIPKDDLSFSHSLNSRKDSGIRSNSRRSSIQHQLFAMNGMTQGDLLNHRVSGYYTSSQVSLNNDYDKVGITNDCSKLPEPLSDSLGACFQKLRKQSDLQLIRCVQVNSQSESSYFISPPLSRWSLLFKDPDLEREYREKAHRTTATGINKSKTLATARFNTYFDITVSLIVFTCVILSAFLTFPFNLPWFSVFIVLLCSQLIVVFLCARSIVKPMIIRRLRHFLQWYPWHFLGGTLVSFPLIAILANYYQSLKETDSIFNYSYLIFIGIVHYCNFTQLNCWMKSTLATIGSIIYLLLVTSTLLNHPQLFNVNSSLIVNEVQNVTSVVLPNKEYSSLFEDTLLSNSRVKRANMSDNFILDNKLLFEDKENYNLKYSDSNNNNNDINCKNCEIINRPNRETYNQNFNFIYNSTTYLSHNLSRSDAFLIELYLDIFLLVFLVWFLNREFEISYRLSFHGNSVAAKDKARVEVMKDQADWLLNNIIPSYVAEHLKSTTKGYSEDVRNAGIIFANIVNFGEMYDESYMEGKECLRVLNELVSDFDELLSQPRFNMVEKIKTIGSTFMAASGLNPSQRTADSNEHLFQLMEFAFALQAAIDNFNTHLLEFNLIMRVGYNFGDLTAGVIGTTKLHYDIWGDAVNIASRMDSTGVPNRIQVPSTCVSVLSSRYVLEPRGTVFVKGKDNMEVFLVVGRKESTSSAE